MGWDDQWAARISRFRHFYQLALVHFSFCSKSIMRISFQEGQSHRLETTVDQSSARNELEQMELVQMESMGSTNKHVASRFLFDLLKFSDLSERQ